MKIHLHIYALLLSTFLISCSSTYSNTSNNAQACNQGKVTLSANFATGRMDKCVKLRENEYLITLVPENTPINSSPWYAFELISEQPTAVKVHMKVQGAEHRYPPKVSNNGKNWKLQPYKLHNDRLSMTVAASSKPTLIAAQEVINNQYYVDWGKSLQKHASISHTLLGNSTQNRPIYKIETNNNNKELIVILGRMHPPEVTGALALFPFVENLLSNNDLAKQFRQQYDLLIIPNINPDGVFMGNWRHNANGLDLNRDWIKFSQKETRLINDYLKNQVTSGRKITFAIDFHSTHQDVFYTMPSDYGVESPYFVEHWLKNLDEAMPNFTVVTQPGNKPGNGVSKQYFADNYKVHAITYEMGDNTDRVKIKDIAVNASITLMETLLSSQNHNKQ